MDDYELACIDENVEKGLSVGEKMLVAQAALAEVNRRDRTLARLSRYESMVNGKWPTSGSAEGKAPLFPADKRLKILELIDKARRIAKNPEQFPHSKGRTTAFIAGALWAGGVYTLQEIGVE